MTKVELIRAISDKTGFHQNEIKHVMNAVKDIVYDAMVNNDPIEVIPGIKFTTRIQNARKLRNIHTGEMYDVPEKTVPKCKFSKKVKDLFI